ncbi:MAG TPA: lipase family protein, partial [Chryseosolibacter sp.]
VTAVAAGAGGYDLPGMLREVTTTTYYASPGYLAFVVMAYNKTYEWNKPLSYFFKEKYAEALSKYLNGQFSGSYINSKLTNRIEDLFNADFLQSLRSDQGSLEIKEALRNNSVAGWKTEVPVRLYHGTKDEIIPFKNSEITLQKFQDAGSINVTLTPIPGGTHGSSFAPMVREFVPWFLSQ